MHSLIHSLIQSFVYSLTEPPEVVRRRIAENLMRSLSADEIFCYDDSADEALLDCSDIERRETEKKDANRQKNKVVVRVNDRQTDSQTGIKTD